MTALQLFYLFRQETVGRVTVTVEGRSPRVDGRGGTFTITSRDTQTGRVRELWRGTNGHNAERRFEEIVRTRPAAPAAQASSEPTLFEGGAR